MQIKGLIVSGIKSGSGKTIISLALMKLLTDKGISIAPFKTGPDFIDPSHYQYFTGFTGRNLDTFMMEEDFIYWNTANAVGKKDGILIEGVMGLFDGYGDKGSGSTAELTRKLNLPVILVIDAKGMSQSVLPLILGFLDWDRTLRIKGIILNRVSSKNHYEFLKEEIEKLKVECLGYIPSIEGLTIKERHLGIHMGHEQNAWLNDAMGKAIETLDIDKIVHLFETSGTEIPERQLPVAENIKVKIAVARDEAFSFYYLENLDLFKYYGADIQFFSPLKDEDVPDADFIYLPGGYPELHVERLSRNKGMKHALEVYIDSGKPMLAECGGFMYLCDGIRWEGKKYPCLGIFPFEIDMGKKFASLGYVDVDANEGNPLFPAGTHLKGHRFHYSYISEKKREIPCGYTITRKEKQEQEGYIYKNTLGSYVHVHFGSNVAAVPQLLKRIQEIKRGSRNNP